MAGTNWWDWGGTGGVMNRTQGRHVGEIHEWDTRGRLLGDTRVGHTGGTVVGQRGDTRVAHGWDMVRTHLWTLLGFGVCDCPVAHTDR